VGSSSVHSMLINPHTKKVLINNNKSENTAKMQMNKVENKKIYNTKKTRHRMGEIGRRRNDPKFIHSLGFFIFIHFIYYYHENSTILFFTIAVDSVRVRFNQIKFIQKDYIQKKRDGKSLIKYILRMM